MARIIRKVTYLDATRVVETDCPRCTSTLEFSKLDIIQPGGARANYVICPVCNLHIESRDLGWKDRR